MVMLPQFAAGLQQKVLGVSEKTTNEDGSPSSELPSFELREAVDDAAKAFLGYLRWLASKQSNLDAGDAPEDVRWGRPKLAAPPDPRFAFPDELPPVPSREVSNWGVEAAALGIGHLALKVALLRYAGGTVEEDE